MKLVFNHVIERVVNAVSTLRRSALKKALEDVRNIDFECGYPVEISTDDYKAMYDRSGFGRRIVDAWPDACWKVLPEIYETENADETPFEKALKALNEEMHLLHYLARADRLSGIGCFGVLLYGFDDGLELSEPVESSLKRKLLYLRVFDESEVDISAFETDVTSPRFGLPIAYNVTFLNASGSEESKTIHWSRVEHIADRCGSNDVYGVPRMQEGYNTLLDLKKTCGGSAEMFWRGGFPGYAITVDPSLDLDAVNIDTEATKQEILEYSEGLRRYLTLTGMNVTSLTPQVADPTGHFKMLIQALAMSIDIPWRVFIGSEEAKLASEQDTKSHHDKVRMRQNQYLTPMVIRPVVKRLQAAGVLPETPNGFIVDWPDLDSPTEKDITENADRRTKAIAQYFTSGADNLIAPRQYLTLIHKFTEDEVNAITEGLDDFRGQVDEDEDEDEDDSTDFDVRDIEP
jgi:hypothetical protein